MVWLRDGSVGALVEAVRREEKGEVALYLDDGATEAVRWAGGVVWATQAMELRDPGCVRCLPPSGDRKRRLAHACSTVVVAMCDPRLDVVRAAAEECRASRLVLICPPGAAFESEAEVNVIRDSYPVFVAPFCALDEDDTVAMPEVVTLANRKLACAFPPSAMARGGGRVRADQLSDKDRRTLRELATDVARLCVELKCDARRRVFAVGPTSALLGTAVVSHLETLSDDDDNNIAIRTPCSLVLVDRTADLSLQHDLNFIAKAMELLPRQAFDTSSEPALSTRRWTSRPVDGHNSCAVSATPLSASRELENSWPAPLSLSAPGARQLARASLVEEPDVALARLRDACTDAVVRAGLEVAPPKAGRGPGAELFEQLKRLVKCRGPMDSSTTGLVALASCAVETSQRAKKYAKKDKDLMQVATKLLHADAPADDVVDFAIDAFERDKASPQAVAAVAAAALAATGGPLRDSTNSMLSKALDREVSPVSLDPAARLNLIDFVDSIANGRDGDGVDDVCVPVGGALESFGAAVGDAIGISRFLRKSATVVKKKKPSPRDQDTVVVFFVGGITCHEIRQIASRHTTGEKRIILASTNLTSTDQICRTVLLRSSPE